MSDVLKARVNLISHLEAQGDRTGIRLACAAFDAMDYFEGMASEEIRNAMTILFIFKRYTSQIILNSIQGVRPWQMQVLM
jgi:hypothetical protein